MTQLFRTHLGAIVASTICVVACSPNSGNVTATVEASTAKHIDADFRDFSRALTANPKLPQADFPRPTTEVGRALKLMQVDETRGKAWLLQLCDHPKDGRKASIALASHLYRKYEFELEKKIAYDYLLELKSEGYKSLPAAFAYMLDNNIPIEEPQRAKLDRAMLQIMKRSHLAPSTSQSRDIRQLVAVFYLSRFNRSMETSTEDLAEQRMVLAEARRYDPISPALPLFEAYILKNEGKNYDARQMVEVAILNARGNPELAKFVGDREADFLRYSRTEMEDLDGDGEFEVVRQVSLEPGE